MGAASGFGVTFTFTFAPSPARVAVPRVVRVETNRSARPSANSTSGSVHVPGNARDTAVPAPNRPTVHTVALSICSPRGHAAAAFRPPRGVPSERHAREPPRQREQRRSAHGKTVHPRRRSRVTAGPTLVRTLRAGASAGMRVESALSTLRWAQDGHVARAVLGGSAISRGYSREAHGRSEEHTSELQSR